MITINDEIGAGGGIMQRSDVPNNPSPARKMF